jgi:hypothetical protein
MQFMILFSWHPERRKRLLPQTSGSRSSRQYVVFTRMVWFNRSGFAATLAVLA